MAKTRKKKTSTRKSYKKGANVARNKKTSHKNKKSWFSRIMDF